MLLLDCSPWLFLVPPKQGLFAHICSMYPSPISVSWRLSCSCKEEIEQRRESSRQRRPRCDCGRSPPPLSLFPCLFIRLRPSSVWLSVSASHPPNPSTDDQTLDLRSTWCIHARLASARRRGGGKRPAQRECPSNASSIDLFDNF